METILVFAVSLIVLGLDLLAILKPIVLFPIFSFAISFLVLLPSLIENTTDLLYVSWLMSIIIITVFVMIHTAIRGD